MTAEPLPLMYTDLAGWFHLLTAPDEYDEETAIYKQALIAASSREPRTLLELGSGGGNLASHYKQHFASTLVDLSPEMLTLSRTINPDCEHVQGDMRTMRLGREFDAVLVHDAVCYMATEADLRQAIGTAFVHCRPGGVALFAPDYVRETFEPRTDTGGHDGEGRGLRYLEWCWDPDPSDTTYLVDYAYLLHEDGKPLRCVQDRHVEGLFSRETWLRLLAESGFEARVEPRVFSDEPGVYEMFVAVRPVG